MTRQRPTFRFAPSPTGPLHLGHAFSAITAFEQAREAEGRFLVRIEDIDHTRARFEWEAANLSDLAWLGLTWEEPVLKQSTRLPAYAAALETLRDKGLLFGCTCRRRDIDLALSAMQEGVTHGPDGPIYPGTCRDNTIAKGAPLPLQIAIRLDMNAALEALPETLTYVETGTSPGLRTIAAKTLPTTAGDIVLARRDYPTSYHLAVTLDDAHQGVTHVTRGEDLASATPIHVALQHLLGLPTPTYHHHRLIRDDAGKRLAKRDDARAIARYRDEGKTPADIRKMIGL